MRFQAGLGGLAVVLSLSANPALAAICLHKSMSLDEIVHAINATPGCERAMKLFEDCELSSSGDIRLGAAVEKKCEGDFLTGLQASQKKAYQREMGVCDWRYAKEDGTMYRSFTAFCRAEIAQRYSQRARKAAR
jgi:hypothetical protein